jgi:hypothetical protein
MKQRLSVVLATVVVTAAVLGWTAVGEAARNLVIPAGSVGTPQLKTGAVTTAKLRAGAVATAKLKTGAVTSLKVRNGSLLVEDFKAGQLPAGQKGDKGDKGDAGPAGPAGVSGWMLVSNSSPSDSDSPKTAQVTCPEGKKALGGGGSVGGAAGLALAVSRPFSPQGNGWVATGREIVATGSSWSVGVYAICGTVNP